MRSGAIAPMISWLAGEGSGSARPMLSLKSSIMPLWAPDSVNTAVPVLGSVGQRISNSPRSINSSSVSTTSAPALLTSVRMTS